MERDAAATWTIANEFAVVRVSVVGRPGRGHRLQVLDPRTGGRTLLDALELELLCSTRHDSLDLLLDPSGPYRADRVLGFTPAVPRLANKSQEEV